MPTQWIGEEEKGESLVAIRDALFNIIVTPIGVLAYIYLQDHVAYEDEGHIQFQTSVSYVEKITGLRFGL